jgi:hypothetical protein
MTIYRNDKSLSFVSGEGSRQLGGLMLIFPSGSHGFPLSEELKSILSVEVEISSERFLAAGEREHWEGNWNGDIDSDLPALNLVLEFVSS